MTTPPAPSDPPAAAATSSSIAFLGIGRAGAKVLEHLRQSGFGRGASLAVTADAQALAASTADRKIGLSPTAHERLAGGEELELVTLDAGLAEALATIIAGKEMVFLIAGLGGHTGTRLTPLLARAAKAAGARVFALVTLPFDWEGRGRRLLAEAGFPVIAELADGVLWLPNQRTEKIVGDGGAHSDYLRAPIAPLAEAARALARLLTLPASLPIHPPVVRAALRGRCCLAFAAAEAGGPERAREIAEKLLAHPLLAGAGGSTRTASVLVSVVSEPEARRDELKLLTERIEAGWPRADVKIGVATDASLAGAMSVLLITSSSAGTPAEAATGAEVFAGHAESAGLTEAPGAGTGDENGRVRRRRPPAKQEQLALDMVSRGRFEKSTPTIHKGEDLDVPTYIRRGITLSQN